MDKDGPLSIIIPEEDASVAGRLNALRCDFVKVSLYPERYRIAVEILTIVEETLDISDANYEKLSSLGTQVMFYFGEDVVAALKDLKQFSKEITLEKKIYILQETLKSYFALRTIK